MRIAFIHLCDFHIKVETSFVERKIAKFLDSINVVNNVDKYVIIFTGDLTYSGKKDEFVKGKKLLDSFFRGIKLKKEGYVELYIVPGNHDMDFPESLRDIDYILNLYKEQKIEEELPKEMLFLKNYFSFFANKDMKNGRISTNEFLKLDDNCTLQINLINSTPFSTLVKNNKELHYFPQDELLYLRKKDDSYLSLTVMHHTPEWFHDCCKSQFENQIISGTDFLFVGHEHEEKTKQIIVNESEELYISYGGEMDFGDIEHTDSYKILLIDTDNFTFSDYQFSWDKKENLYVHEVISKNKKMSLKNETLKPAKGFFNTLMEDTHIGNASNCFVFPRLSCDKKDEFGNSILISNENELEDKLNEHKYIKISGGSLSGKTTLLKHIYSMLAAEKIPLFVSFERFANISTNKFIQREFENQYGECKVKYEKYLQSDKNDRVIIIDDWDRIINEESKAKLLDLISNFFGYAIITTIPENKEIISDIKEKIEDSVVFQDFSIQPFFIVKRNELVKKVCNLSGITDDIEINKINKFIDNVALSNQNLFSLNPGFIIKFTNFFIKNPNMDAPKAEEIFSIVFEHEINDAVIKTANKTFVNETMTVFEEIAGYILKIKNDTLKVKEFNEVVEAYNDNYGINLNSNEIYRIGIDSKLFKSENDKVFFANKNYLSFFIAKYLCRTANTSQSATLIDNVLRNICYGINSDILLFMLYITKNTEMIMRIADYADQILEGWEEFSFEQQNISYLYNTETPAVSAPKQGDKEKIESKIEKIEKEQYDIVNIETRGIFDYDEDNNNVQSKIDKAIIYTELICKVVPSFNNILDINQKKRLLKQMHVNSNKIIYAMLKPFDDNFERIIDELYAFSMTIIGDEKK